MIHVSRSVYQKLKEENKSLLKDIYAMTMNSNDIDTLEIIQKWRLKFRNRDEFNRALIKAALTMKFK